MVKREGERELEAWWDCEVDVHGETIELGLLLLAHPSKNIGEISWGPKWTPN